MKTTEVNFYGRTCHLRLTTAALYDIYERFGKDKGVFENIDGSGKDAFDAACWYFAKLAEQGELTRRLEGHEAQPVITEEDVRILMVPRDLPNVKKALIRTLQRGFACEVEDDEPIDVGLLELQKKTATAEAAPNSSKPRRSFWASLFGTHT